MIHHHLRLSNANLNTDAPKPGSHSSHMDLSSPCGKLDGLNRNDFREAAYEIFFTSCRSYPGFGGWSAITYYNSSEGGDGNGSGPGSPMKPPGVGMAVTSRVKRALGLRMLKRSVIFQMFQLMWSESIISKWRRVESEDVIDPTFIASGEAKAADDFCGNNEAANEGDGAE